MAPRLLATFLLLAAVAGCLGTEAPAPDGSAGSTSAAPPPELRFLAIGDMGTGGEDQARVAKAMKAVCALRGCDLVVGLGDLIYPAGASSPDDPQFDTKFEQPYAGLDLPFWMVLGNHDNSQDPAATSATGGLGLWYSAGDNEVAYTYRTDRATERWHMPARHYTMDAAPVHFVGLDTNTLLFYGVPVSADLAEALQEQEDWLPGAVAEGNASWRIAIGHHPYVSNGPHGDAGEYDDEMVPGQDGDHLKELFERDLCDKVDLYLAGHDHDLQWLEPVPSCGRTHFIVSGGGGASLYGLGEEDKAAFQKESLGFWWLDVKGGTLTAAAYDEDATLLFERSIAKPIPVPA